MEDRIISLEGEHQLFRTQYSQELGFRQSPRRALLLERYR